MGSLDGQVCLVTGASRGIGKGIALVLAGEGAIVYVTGRTVEPGTNPVPGTVGQTAEECTARGGLGIAVPVDHAEDTQVAELFERIECEQGRLDVLVNNAFQLPDDLPDERGFWDKSLAGQLKMLDVGVRSTVIASWYAARLMIARRHGLIVAISGYTGVSYTFNPVFGMCKSAVDRLARDMAVELLPHEVCSISLWQALTITEKVQQSMARAAAHTEASTRIFGQGSTVEHPGRVVAAVAADPDLMRHSGGTFITAELAQAYGVRDIDGREIPSLRVQRGAPIWQPVRVQRSTSK